MLRDDGEGAMQHRHVYGIEQYGYGERRTRWVVALTVVMMVVEIAAGTIFGSMALLADGWHMATHAAALGIAAFAYSFARRRANDERFTFGTGKVTALGGFGSAVTLAVVAALVLVESVGRLVDPVSIRFDEAIAVAVVGLVVNLVSAVLLRDDHHHEAHEHSDHHEAHEHSHHHDHNLRGAYLHVLADALTSVTAIVALVIGRQLGWTWVDAASGILGALVIGKWSLGLLKDTGAVLLDSEVRDELRTEVKAAVEADGGGQVTDLHLWRVGPSHLAVIVSISSSMPQEPEHYKQILGRFAELVHVTVEVNRAS
jgi:cation diffusion facilitator family transporter